MRRSALENLKRYFLKAPLYLAGLILFLSTVHATPVNEYHKHLSQAIIALDSLVQLEENETASAFEARNAETILSVRQLVPANETIEWAGKEFTVDNSWLPAELDKYTHVSGPDRSILRQQIIERLQAIAERVKEIPQPAATGTEDKAQHSTKLGKILQRPEYARKVKQESAIGRLWRQFLKWLESLFPKPKPIAPGTAGIFSKIAQVFVIVLALAVLIFVVRLFLPRLLHNRRAKRKVKQGARIVLGERLEPEQSATDLLSEAEALARAGDLRAAIRKAYIALLLELGERKIITLEQHKTNQDYLRAVRRVERLYPNVKQLTDSFELHWYGLALVTETDWQTFRSGYKQALST